MTLEPRVQWIVRVSKALDRSPEGGTMVQRRIDAAAQVRRLGWVVLSPGPAVPQEDLLVPVDGGRITVRLYRPATPGPHPLHVFLHGGGWCVGTLDERDPRCRTIAAGAECVVASVDYRMAPEHHFPTAPEDSYAALCWLVEHAEALGLDASRVSVSGESAGANLAAVVCLMARDRGGPAIRYQWLDVPATDLTLSQPSFREVPDGYLLDADRIVEYRDHYLASVSQATDPYASPLLAPDLSGLPEAWIMSAQFDKLRDDGTSYARRLADAGVTVHHQILPGHAHPTFAFTRLVPSARTYEASAIAALRAALRD